MRKLYFLVLGGLAVACSNQNPLLSHKSDKDSEEQSTEEFEESQEILRQSGDVVQSSLLDDTGYCVSKGNSTEKEFIQSVNFTDTVTSGDDKGYKAPVVMRKEVKIGNESITLKSGYYGTKFNEYWRVWIDFDQNKEFADSERVYAKDKDKASNTGHIVIPAFTKAGEARMRVSMRFGAAPAPCGNFAFGEVEDYKITVPKQIAGLSLILDNGRLKASYRMNFEGALQIRDKSGARILDGSDSPNIDGRLFPGVPGPSSKKDLAAANFSMSVGDQVKFCDIADPKTCSDLIKVEKP